jgi:hypothetical protein
LPAGAFAPPDPASRSESPHPMSTLFNIIAILFMAAVVIVLLRGLLNMLRGGSGNTSNKLMQARVILQFCALVFIVLALWFSRG